jgi:hypothetical protein
MGVGLVTAAASFAGSIAATAVNLSDGWTHIDRSVDGTMVRVMRLTRRRFRLPPTPERPSLVPPSTNENR